MTDEPTIVDGPSAVTAPRVLTKKERREQRRAAAREAAELEEAEANEPEPDPTVCAWCGFSAFFDEETPEADKTKCPACTIPYDDPLAKIIPADNVPSIEGIREQVARDAVHRRMATALDNLYALFADVWERWQEASEGRGGFR